MEDGVVNPVAQDQMVATWFNDYIPDLPQIGTISETGWNLPGIGITMDTEGFTLKVKHVLVVKGCI